MEDNQAYLFFSFIIIAIGMGCILYSALANFFRKLFLTKGEVVQGFVFDVERRTREGIILGNWDDDWDYTDKVTIRFTTKKKELITADLDSSSGLVVSHTGKYCQGDKILVIYQPDNPQDFYIVSKKVGEKEQIIFAVIGLIAIAVGIFFLITA